MLFLRLGKTLALWAAVWVLIAHGWVVSTRASSLDTSVPWGIPLVLAPMLGAWLLARWGHRRQPHRWSALDGDQLALLALLGALLVAALANLGPYTSVRVLREQIPPLFLWLYPTLAFLAPLAMARAGKAADVAQQALVGALVLVGPSSVLMLDGARALTVAVPVLLLQLAAQDGRIGPGRALRLLLVVCGLLAVSTLVGPSPLTAMPALAWIATFATLGLAIAARPRDAAAVRSLLAATVTGACLVAICGAQLTTWLALEVDLEPALKTRLVLFQQHPNFLAPLFAIHAILALGLAVEARRGRALAVAAFLLLAGSTVITDSRAGIGALIVGCLAMPVLLVVGRRGAASRADGSAPRAPGPRRPGWPVLIGLALAVVLAFGSEAITGWVGERMAKSTDYRVDAWRNSLAIIGDEPWLGIGPHTFVTRADFAPGSRFFNEPEAPHPHNALLYLTQAAGLPALAVFVAFLIALLGALLRNLRRADGVIGRAAAAGILAASAGLLAANTLDLGLALQTVVPIPFFLFAALLAGARRPPEQRATRLPPLVGILWLVALALPWIRLGVDPARADTELERAQLLSWMSTQRAQDAELLDDAMAACQRAIDLDPDAVHAYELLARWEETRPGGVLAAHDVLRRLIERAPLYGPSHALLGQTHLRAGMDDKALESLRRAIDSEYGSVDQTTQRAATVGVLARLGRRDEAAQLLVEALRLDIGVVERVGWQRDPRTGERVLPVAGDRALPLVEAVEMLYARHVREREQGHEVGRKYWMDTYLAFRKASRDDLALAVLDDLEANVPAVEPHSIVIERAKIAEDRGDLDTAIAQWREADALAPNPFYATQVTRLRARQGDIEESRAEAVSAFTTSGEILDQPTAFRDNLDARYEAALRDARPGEAAELLERTLLYVDDPLARAQRLLRAGNVYLQAARWEDAERCLTRSLVLLTARPYPVALLQEGHDDSTPGRIARGLLAAWRGLGLDADTCQRRAWGLPDYFSPRAAPSLFRLAFFAENGQMDHLLKEAELQLLADPERLLAQWARLEALEGLGRLDELRAQMRAIAERFAARHAVNELHRQLVHDVQVNDRMGDWRAWKEMAVLKLLSGGYSESADMFGQARELLADKPRVAAQISGWQARALLLSDRPDRHERARDLLAAAVRTVPESGSLRARLEALP